MRFVPQMIKVSRCVCTTLVWFHARGHCLLFRCDWTSVCRPAGITRLQRWERAQLHGLDPPKEIRELLLQTHAQSEHRLKYTHTESPCSSLHYRHVVLSEAFTLNRSDVNCHSQLTFQNQIPHLGYSRNVVVQYGLQVDLLYVLI